MKKEVKIGLAGIASLLILFFGINYLKGVNMFKPESLLLCGIHQHQRTGYFKPGICQRLKVGLVRDIQYNYQKPGHVVVGIEWIRQCAFRKGSRADW